MGYTSSVICGDTFPSGVPDEPARWGVNQGEGLICLFTKYTPTYIGVYYQVYIEIGFPERGKPPDFDGFIPAKSHKTNVKAQSY